MHLKVTFAFVDLGFASAGSRQSWKVPQLFRLGIIEITLWGWVETSSIHIHAFAWRSEVSLCTWPCLERVLKSQSVSGIPVLPVGELGFGNHYAAGEALCVVQSGQSWMSIDFPRMSLSWRCSLSL